MPNYPWSSLEGPESQKAGLRRRFVDKSKSIGKVMTPAGLKAAAMWFYTPAGIPFWKQIFPHNLKAGITVALVSVPLSIALAVAGGAQPSSGVVTAFWAGLTAALTGGSHFNIVGPTGALSGVLQATVDMFPTEDPNLSVLPLVSLISGTVALIFYLLRLERLVLYIPSSVVHGFTLGVAFTIFGGQLRAAFGFHKGYTGHTQFMPYCNCGLDSDTPYWDYFAATTKWGLADSGYPQVGYCSVVCSFDGQNSTWPWHPADCQRLGGNITLPIDLPYLSDDVPWPKKCVDTSESSKREAYFLAPLETANCTGALLLSTQTCIVKHDEFILNFIATVAAWRYAGLWSAMFFLLNTLALLSLLSKFPKVPWTILIAFVGILFGWLETNDYIPVGFDLTTLREEYPNQVSVQIVGRPYLQCNSFSDCWLLNPKLYQQALTICFIGVLETLISARIADKLTNTRHDQRREVVGLGLANIVTGLTGGIPATAALARTALNVKSGATSRIAGVISALCILLIAVLLFEYFVYLPMPTIACILLMVAIRMVDTHHLKHMWKWDKPMFIVSIVTAFICVVADTSLGIVVGALLSLLIAADQLSSGYSELTVALGDRPLAHPNPARVDFLAYAPPPLTTEKNEGDVKVSVPGFESHELINFDDIELPEAKVDCDTLVYRFVGSLLFINGPGHEKRVRQLLANDSSLQRVILSLVHCFRSDLDGLDTLGVIIGELKAAEKMVILVRGINNFGLNVEAQEWYQELLSSNLVFPTEEEALRATNEALPMREIPIPLDPLAPGQSEYEQSHPELMERPISRRGSSESEGDSNSNQMDGLLQ